MRMVKAFVYLFISYLVLAFILAGQASNRANLYAVNRHVKGELDNPAYNAPAPGLPGQE